MNANRLTLIAAALTLVACSNNQPDLTGPARADETAPPVAVHQQIHGTVTLDQESNTVLLQTEFGTMSIRGAAASEMASVDGAEVLVSGTVDETMGMTAETFQVLGFQGHPALDGYLEIDGDYNHLVRLANGDLVVIDNPPKTLRLYVGQRVWVIPSEDDEPVAFGLISGTPANR